MERIASFCVDHTKLQKGIYTSRIDDDVVTYDIRMRRPNCGDYICNEALHTFEHLLATYVRNSRFKDHIIYVGPMGCRTGFYFIVRNLGGQDVIDIIRESMRFILDFSGDIPGARPAECGNYKEHSLDAAKVVAKDMLDVLRDWTPAMLEYDYLREENLDIATH